MRYRYSAEENGKPVRKAVVYTQDEHCINLADVDREAVYIIERLKANGFDAYIVGGAVRDLILGKKPKDFDIVTAAAPLKLKKIFRNSRVIGHRFRLVHVYFGSRIYEVATFRSVKDGPTSNTFGTIEEDVLRRDFTLNALFYDPLMQIVVDYVGGMKDIAGRKIRHIIPLRKIFTDDPVRMIRAVKYAACTNFALPLSLGLKIRSQSGLLETVSHSRLTEELSKIIHSPHAAAIVRGLENMGLYQFLQPAAANLFKTKPGFKEQYLKSLEAAGQPDFKNGAGEALSALIKDYLEDTADWDGSNPGFGGEEGLPLGVPRPSSERYREAFALARQFVLPMNPPRVQLDHAVRLLFASHGVTIKKTRLDERQRPRRPDEKKPGDAENARAPSAPDPHKKRRRNFHTQRET